MHLIKPLNTRINRFPINVCYLLHFLINDERIAPHAGLNSTFTSNIGHLFILCVNIVNMESA